VFERGVNRKKNKGRVDVGEHERNCKRRVEKRRDWAVSDVQVLEKAVEDSVAAENGFPGVAADEIADPQRHDDQLVEEFLARAGVKREVIGERVAEE
jgi:hypothetical protein